MTAFDFPDLAKAMRDAAREGKLGDQFRELLDQHGTADIAFGSLSLLGFLVGNSAPLEDCRLALENGASESDWKRDQRIPEMHLAALNADPMYVELLLDHGFSVKSLDIDGNTPLHAAIQDQKIDVANVLLVRGADPDLKNSRGESPRDLATIYGVSGIEFDKASGS